MKEIKVTLLPGTNVNTATNAIPVPNSPDPRNLNGKGWNWNTGVSPIKCKGKGYSRNEIAKETGLSREFVTRIFSGKRRVSLASALTLAAFFNCDVEYLLAVVIPSNIQPTKRPSPATLNPRKPRRRK
jgi:DNA-binding XRE family transcriptional regulator